MSTGLYSHTTRATGTILTAAIYNADHQNHITNQNPAMTGALADSVAEFRSTADPGGVGSESLPGSLAGELQRLRYQINRIVGKGTQWYDAPSSNIEFLFTNLTSGGINSKAVDYTTVASDKNKVIAVTVAGKIITLLAAATAGNAYGLFVNNQSTGDITVKGSGAETIDGSNTVIVPKGRGLWVETNGTTWNTGGQNWPENIVVRSSPMFQPMGRLCLTTGVPVHTADVTAQATVFYTPKDGAAIPLFNGTDWFAYSFTEVSQALSDTTKSPAASAASNVYDYFAWLDGTTFRVTRGPTWASGGGSNTARGTGAGSSELVRVNGVWMNANAITNGPAAQRGVWVGTVATDGANQLNMKMNPAPAAGGGNCRLDVWNMYNRVPTSAISKDSTDTWIYVSGTIRPANNNTNNRVTAVFGLNEDVVNVNFIGGFQQSNTGAKVGVGLDSTTAFSGAPGVYCNIGSPGSDAMVPSFYTGIPGSGSHFFQALEAGTTNTVFAGDNGAPTLLQMSLIFNGRM